MAQLTFPPPTNQRVRWKVETEIKLRVRGGFAKIRHSLRKHGKLIRVHRVERWP